MSEHVYKTVEITGSSPAGVDEAMRNGIDKARQTLRNLDWFEVAQVRGHLTDEGVDHFQVTMKVGFRLE